MEAIEYLKIKGRMTKKCSIPCCLCPLSISNNGELVSCKKLDSKHPEIALEIVENWAKEHPTRTRQNELLRLFPDLPICKEGFTDLCPKSMDKGFKCPKSTRCWDCRKEYWLGEIEEDEK